MIVIVSDFHERKIEDVIPQDIMNSAMFIITAGDFNYQYPSNCIGVYGNHECLTELIKPTLNNVHMKTVTFHGYTFTGIMGVFCGEKRYNNPQRRRWYHQVQSEVDSFLSKTPSVDFFVTHERAYGIFDTIHGKHVGNQGYRKYIDEKQPKYYISGHIMNDEKLIMVGKTLCINPHSHLWDFVILEVPQNKVKFMKNGEEVNGQTGQDIGSN